MKADLLSSADARAWRLRVSLILSFAALCFGGVLLGLDPIPQKPSYHNFSDSRPWLGIPNFQNVVSNLPFLFVGMAGIGKFETTFWKLGIPSQGRLSEKL